MFSPLLLLSLAIISLYCDDEFSSSYPYIGLIYVFSDAAGASGQWLSPQQLNQMAEWSFMLG